MSFYEKYILPRILNCACASEPITYQRKKVVPLAEGKILEVGIGSGLNLPFYDKSKIEEIWGIDPSEELNAMAKKVAIEECVNVNFITSSAEDIPFPNDYFDTVLITYTMCTIPSVLQANKEIKRVLKSSGKMIFCEHGVSPDENIKKWQKRLKCCLKQAEIIYKNAKKPNKDRNHKNQKKELAVFCRPKYTNFTIYQSIN